MSQKVGFDVKCCIVVILMIRVLFVGGYIGITASHKSLEKISISIIRGLESCV